MLARCSLLALALATPTAAQTVKTILNNGPVGNRYDIVILGDGYQANEEATFDADAQAAIAGIFANPAWGDYQSYFNAHTVFRASMESGADQPDVTPPIFVDTAYDSTYNTGGTPRCLYIGDEGLATQDALRAPDTEGRVIVLVNDPRYGGCAGTFAVSSTGSGIAVVAHEFGHSFASLADEYGGSGSYSGTEPSQANITADPTGMAKWPLWLGSGGVSAFEGAGYYNNGLWRPESSCMMNNLAALCEVCEEQVVKSTYMHVSAIESATPPAGPISLAKGATQAFAFTNIAPGATTTSWTVNGVVAQVGGTTFTFDSTGLSSGAHVVAANVTDTSTFVRKDPANLMTSRRQWTVTVTTSMPGSYTTFGQTCLGSTIFPPTLRAIGVPELGTSFDVQLQFGTPSSTATLIFGGSKTTWGGVPLPFNLAPLGAPNCSIKVSMDVLVPVPTNATGFAEVNLAIPQIPALVGGIFHNQWFALDPGANALGAYWTNGGTATVGL